MRPQRQPKTYKPYSQEELDTIQSLFDEGHTAQEIGELMERTPASIYQTLSKIRKGTMKATQETPAEQDGTTQKVAPPSEATRKEMTPREMIKKLYDMGYRIENNKLVCYQKIVVKVDDILNDDTRN